MTRPIHPDVAVVTAEVAEAVVADVVADAEAAETRITLQPRLLLLGLITPWVRQPRVPRRRGVDQERGPI